MKYQSVPNHPNISIPDYEKPSVITSPATPEQMARSCRLIKKLKQKHFPDSIRNNTGRMNSELMGGGAA